MIKVIEDCLTIPIGTYLDYEGKRLRVDFGVSCSGCYFQKKNLTKKEKDEDFICKMPPVAEVGFCSQLRRSDKKSVVFKLTKKK